MVVSLVVNSTYYTFTALIIKYSQLVFAVLNYSLKHGRPIAFFQNFPFRQLLD